MSSRIPEPRASNSPQDAGAVRLLTPGEQRVLTVLGLLFLTGLVVMLWQYARATPLTVEHAGQPADAAHWDQALEQARRLNLNTASAVELERLPEIGPSLARRIVEYRQAHGRFQSTAELNNVPGIGPKTLQQVEPYVHVN